MKNNATVVLALRAKGRGHGLINIRVTYNRDSRMYAANTSIDLTEEQFRNPKLKITKQALEEANDALQIAQGVIKELGTGFTFTTFHTIYIKRLRGGKKDTGLFSVVADDYMEGKKPKTCSICNTAIKWVERFHSNTHLNDITTEFVRSLIQYIKDTSLSNNGKEMSENTLRIYLRTLSAVYSFAIKTKNKTENGTEKGTVINPFRAVEGQQVDSIPRMKGAMEENEFNSFLSYTPTNDKERFAKDFFLLSFYLSGMNMGDLLSLKNANIKDENIEFRRRKTRKTKIDTVVPLIDEAYEILNKYGHINLDAPDEYILPYLSHCKTEESIDSKIHDVIRKINKGLKEICKKVGIKEVTTYYARHTYGSLAQDYLKPEQIQKFFGHTSSKTTEIYLRSLSTTTIKKNRKFLEGIVNNKKDAPIQQKGDE